MLMKAINRYYEKNKKALSSLIDKIKYNSIFGVHVYQKMMKEIDDDNDDNNEIEHIPVVGSFRQIKEKLQEKFSGKDWRIILGGQLLSFLLAATGAASATLHFECNLSAPTAQMGLVYFLLSFRAIDYIRNIRIKEANHRNKKMLLVYPLIAFLDVEANYFTFLAFRYTTLNSVSIFDALAIPSAMICSRLLLRVSYSSIHYYGALICMLGVILNVIRDYTDSSSDENSRMKQEYPHQLLGDAIAIIGGLLHGFRDVMTEYAVKQLQKNQQDEIPKQQQQQEETQQHETHVDTNEYLGMIGVFGVLISIIQCLLLERTAVHDFFQPHINNNNSNSILSTRRWLEDADIVFNSTNTYSHRSNDDDEYFTNNAWYTVTSRDHSNSTSAADYGGFELPTCSESMGLWILMGYVLATYGTYVGTSRFLVVSEAAFLNLSLLTGDLWAVLFSVLAEHILPKPLFWIALFLIMGGVLTYEMAPSPMTKDIHSSSQDNDNSLPPPIKDNHDNDNDTDTHSIASSCSGQYSVHAPTCSPKGDPIVEFAPSYVVFSEPDKAAGSPRQDTSSVCSKPKKTPFKKQRFRRSRKINQKAASALFLVDDHHDLELVVTV